MRVQMMRKLRVVSAILKWIFILALFIYPIFYLVVSVAGLIVNHYSMPMETAGPGIWFLWQFPVARFYGLPISIQIIGFLVSLAPLVFFVLKNYYLARLFYLYQHGTIFALDNVRYIRNIGVVILVWEIVRPFYQILMSLLLSSQNPPGHHQVSFQINGTDISMLIIAIIIIVVSWIMREGVELEQENRLTV